MAKPIRLVLAHVNENGTSGLEQLSVPETRKFDENGKPIFAGHLAWGSDDRIPVIGANQIRVEGHFVPFFPAVGGHRFTVFSHLPESWSNGGTVPEDWKQKVDETADSMPGLMEKFDPERPGMHLTDTIDYVYIISGEIDYVVDDEEVHVTSGDLVIQRGNWHAWRNRGTEPCVLVSVLIGAERQ